MFGRGQILRIDLSKSKVWSEPISSELAYTCTGGEGINSRLLWEHFLKIDPATNPLGEDNVLIAGTGPLAATGYGQGSKMKWTFKSPVYNLFGDSSSGGNFIFSLRSAGYDHIVITGCASEPSYIWIDDENIEIRSATHLWGKGTRESHQLIKKDLGDSDIETALIGIAAENGVRFGSIIVSQHRGAGRTGGGSVMASKNIKGIAVRGRKGIPIYDPAAFMKASDDMIAARNSKYSLLDRLKRFGTLPTLGLYQETGINAYRNNQGCLLPQEKYALINHDRFTEKFARAPWSCVGCISGCSSIWTIRGDETPLSPKWIGEIGSRPEFGAQASWGAMCDIPDWAAICHFWHKADDYGYDVFEIGASCALLMELWQRGIIDSHDIKEWFGKPITLEWGNHEAVDMVMDAIAQQNNELGKLLNSGVHHAAEAIGDLKNESVLQYALYGKGGAAFIEDVRHTPGWATNFAVASRGCDHLKGIGTLDKSLNEKVSEHYFGTREAARFLSTQYMGANAALQENWLAMINSLGVCVMHLASDPVTFSADMFAEAVSAVTGQDISGNDLLTAGERTVNLEKAFNSRLGMRREQDTLCDRWMHEPVPEGPGVGWKCDDYLDQTKDEYYEWHGWDKETSLQTRQKLDQLDMNDVANILVKEGFLV